MHSINITNLKCEHYRRADFLLKCTRISQQDFAEFHKKYLENCRNYYTYSNFVCSLTHCQGELGTCLPLWFNLEVCVCVCFHPGNPCHLTVLACHMCWEDLCLWKGLVHSCLPRASCQCLNCQCGMSFKNGAQLLRQLDYLFSPWKREPLSLKGVDQD